MVPPRPIESGGRSLVFIHLSSQTTDPRQVFPVGLGLGLASNRRVKFWERPAPRLLVIFSLLGLFAWWTFRIVSFPPVVRNLLAEDLAVAAAATPASEEERFQQELSRMPSPPQDHAPEVTSLLQRLKDLPPLPYILEVALQRDAATPKGEARIAWNQAEEQALREAKEAFLAAWEPFLTGASPEWRRFPDSVLLFRARIKPWSGPRPEYDKLLTYNPEKQDKNPEPEVADFYLKYARQMRSLGTVRFGWGLNNWSMSDTVAVSEFTTEVVSRIIPEETFPIETLQALRSLLPAPPSVADLREGLESDQSLFARTAGYLESLPAYTSAKAGLTKWLGNDSDADWYLQRSGQPGSAKDLAALLRRDADLLNFLHQKTFLSGPAWRQWLSGNPGDGLPRLLAEGLGGVKDFEKTRTVYLINQAVLDARIALEAGGWEAARKVPDPSRPGFFLRIEETAGGARISSAYVPEGKTNPVSFFVAFPPANSP